MIIISDIDGTLADTAWIDNNEDFARFAPTANVFEKVKSFYLRDLFTSRYIFTSRANQRIIFGELVDIKQLTANWLMEKGISSDNVFHNTSPISENNKEKAERFCNVFDKVYDSDETLIYLEDRLPVIKMIQKKLPKVICFLADSGNLKNIVKDS